MARKRGLTLARNPEITRLCRYCARPHRETDYPEGNTWICQPCRDNGILPIIPLLRGDDWARFDTNTLFAGYRVVRNPPATERKGMGKGERTEYENEVHSPTGVFYAAAEAAFAFETKTTKMANILLRQFPEGRLQASGDDGQCVLIFPARLDLFRAVAKKVGAYRPRTVTDETRAKLAAAREVAEERRQAAAQTALDL